MTHQWYYDLTEDHCYSGGVESLLVWLCDDCANRLAEVQFAGTDAVDEYIACDVPCWQCHKLIDHVERTE
ncbi:hypothetical protein ACFLYD_03320 [Chloroflexota bacterium]